VPIVFAACRHVKGAKVEFRRLGQKVRVGA